MSDDSILTQFTSRIAPPKSEREEPQEAPENLGAFGWLRGRDRDRAVMLELRRKDGSMVALGYAWLVRVEFNPSGGITLRFADQQVKIIGRNLNAEVRPNVRLVDGLVRHRVPWIQEANEPIRLGADRRATVIERFEFK